MKRDLAANIADLLARTGQELSPEERALIGASSVAQREANRGETLFWDLLAREGRDIPLPQCLFHGGQARVPCNGITLNPNLYEPDFLWEADRLIVEIDGGIHTVRDRQIKDCFRKNNLTLAGYRVLTFTPHMVDWYHKACLNYVRKALNLPLIGADKRKGGLG